MAPAPVAPEAATAQPAAGEPIASDRSARDEPPPPVAAAEEPPPPDPVRESRPVPSWTPIETRQARSPAHRREPPAPSVTADAAGSQPPERVGALGELPAVAAALPGSDPSEVTPAATPLEWLARLQRAYGPKSGPQAPGRPQPPARVTPLGQPISMANREVLEPMLGIDAGSVRVHQGPDAAAAAAALQADALTVGEHIVLGAGRQDSDPKTVGLLAHELLHIARQRTPRFVPPVLRGAPRPTEPGRPPFRPSAGVLPPHRPGERTPVVAQAAEEEAMALVVEAAAIATSRDRARGATPAPGTTGSGPSLSAPSPIAGTPAIPQAPLPWSAPADGENQPPWGSLPAPWEPLPGQPEGQSELPSGDEPLGASAPPGPAPWPVTTTAPIQRAGEERHQGERATGPHGTAPGPGAAAKVDLDALAKQVYTVLKRRLAGERRRAL